MTYPIFHRGWEADGLDENTRESLDAAKAHGGGVEFDIRPTLDDYIVVFHDATWDRMTAQTGYVKDTTFDVATSYVTNGGFPVPSFKSALNRMDGVVSLVELKGQSLDWSDTALQRISITVRELQAENRAHFFSLDETLAPRLKTVCPNLQIMLRPSDGNFSVASVMGANYAGVICPAANIGPNRAQSFRDAGLLIYAQEYSVDTKAEFNEIGADGANGAVVNATDYVAWTA